MSVRAIGAKIECDRATLQSLWRTHLVFNERLPTLLAILFRMRRGEYGRSEDEQRLYQTLFQFILQNSQNAEYLLNSISIPGWKPATAKKYKAMIVDADGVSKPMTGDSWAEQVARLSAEGVLLYEKSQVLMTLPPLIRNAVCRECAAIIHGHEELSSLWEKEHLAWIERKSAWELIDEHKKYLGLRNRFEIFETEAGGQAGKRRGRWHLYIEWLRNNPDLAAWRGCQAGIHPINADAEKRIKNAKPWKQRSVEAEEFWKANPELQALDKLHGEYEREFIRRRKTKKNHDGFDHRPTFTLPNSTKHPRWLVFSGPQTSPEGYRDLELSDSKQAAPSITLNLITSPRSPGPTGGYGSEWVPVSLRVDPRMLQFRKTEVLKTVYRGRRKGEQEAKAGYEWYDKHLKLWRPAQISGAKLIFRKIRLNADGTMQSAIPYLTFTCTIDDLPLTDRAKKIEWLDTNQITATGNVRKKRKLPDGLISCAVDLGIRHIGFATIAQTDDGKTQVIRSRNIWVDENGKGPDLAHIGRHKREIRQRRRERGKPVAGENSHVQLQDHITNMAEDRFKRAAREILNFALNAGKCYKKDGVRADVIILERLAGFIPDAERERGINRALVNWNRGQLVDTIKQMAVDAGFKGRIFEVHPAGTSQVCSKCGQMGRRYSIVRDDTTHAAVIRFGWVEKLFACPFCGYRANSDHNASVNLHRKFVSESAVSEFLKWSGLPKDQKKERVDEIETLLRPILEQEHHLGFWGVETPF